MFKARLFKELCQLIVRHCPNYSAQAYARAGVHMDDESDINAQIPYILRHLHHWRGERAKFVKMSLWAMLPRRSTPMRRAA